MLSNNDAHNEYLPKMQERRAIMTDDSFEPPTIEDLAETLYRKHCTGIPPMQPHKYWSVTKEQKRPYCGECYYKYVQQIMNKERTGL